MKRHLIDLTLTIVGNLILAFAVRYFILPYNILSGGVAGIAVALAKLSGIAADIWVNSLIIGLFLIGSVFLGKKFAAHTALSSFLYPAFLWLLNYYSFTMDIDPMLASLYGGLLGGLGVGIVFRTGASTGGMDVPPLILNKITHIDLHRLVLLVDALTVMLGIFVYGIEAVLIGLISVWASSFAVDKALMFGTLEAETLMIISNKLDDINTLILKKVDRGSTFLKARGGYTHQDKDVLFTVIARTEYPELIKDINAIDPHAFVVVTDAMEVRGNGFSFDYKV